MTTRLVADNLSKTYGRQTVLSGVTFSVHDRDRIGLIGRNGAGKTTLLRIIAGQEEPDGGAVTLAAGARLGVLDQHEVLPGESSAVEYLSAATGQPEWECRRLAARFGLNAADLEIAPGNLSGGYQMRLKLVRLLLTEPNVLLLDEPVNYLDLPTLVHLERFLRRWPGAFIVTSHDRELLQNLCSTTWDLRRGELAVFKGNVGTYLDWRDEQEEYARRTNKKLRREIAHTQEFVDRFRYKASLASQAQSKIKHIAKLRSKLKSLESDLPAAGFRLDCPPVVAGTAVSCLDLAVGYGQKTVAGGINLEFPRGSKVGIVGENGRGKTTLLKTLAGILPPLAGKAKWWHRADIGYFSQDSAESLHPDRTVLQTLYAAAPAETSAEKILATAGAFLFREDDLEKPCRVLSGGERSRLRLAGLTLRNHNVLLLDEPTNHLDFETVEVLAGALRQYQGTVVVVSHARTFMNSLVDRIYEVGFGTVRQFLGTYEEYVADLSARAEADDAAGAGGVGDKVSFGRGAADVGGAAASGSAGGPALAAGETEAAVQTHRLRQQERRQRQRLIQKLEEKLAAAEKEKGKIMMFFFENPTEYDRDKQERLAVLEGEIAGLEAEWLKLNSRE